MLPVNHEPFKVVSIKDTSKPGDTSVSYKMTFSYTNGDGEKKEIGHYDWCTAKGCERYTWCTCKDKKHLCSDHLITENDKQETLSFGEEISYNGKNHSILMMPSGLFKVMDVEPSKPKPSPQVLFNPKALDNLKIKVGFHGGLALTRKPNKHGK